MNTKTMSHLRMLSHLAAVFTLIGCMQTKPYTDPGIQPEEAVVLTKYFYWRQDKDSKKYTDEHIRAVLARSLVVDPMDGEKSELHASTLRYAQAATGDAHFAQLLAEESPETQQAVAKFMASLISVGGLSYPQTDSLLKKVQDLSAKSQP